jgi:hypothetical protein
MVIGPGRTRPHSMVVASIPAPRRPSISQLPARVRPPRRILQQTTAERGPLGLAKHQQNPPFSTQQHQTTKIPKSLALIQQMGRAPGPAKPRAAAHVGPDTATQTSHQRPQRRHRRSAPATTSLWPPPVGPPTVAGNRRARRAQRRRAKRRNIPRCGARALVRRCVALSRIPTRLQGRVGLPFLDYQLVPPGTRNPQPSRRQRSIRRTLSHCNHTTTPTPPATTQMPPPTHAYHPAVVATSCVRANGPLPVKPYNIRVTCANRVDVSLVTPLVIVHKSRPISNLHKPVVGYHPAK